MIKKQFSKFNKKGSAFFVAAIIMMVFTAFFAVSVNALSDAARPTILSVSPGNNEQDISELSKSRWCSVKIWIHRPSMQIQLL